MRINRRVVSAALLLLVVMSSRLMASTSLRGVVVDEVGAPMEGVLVIAKPQQGDWLVSVASNAQGVFAFPANRLPMGDYTLSVRVTGFDLIETAGREVSISSSPQEISLKLSPVSREQLASQLTSLEWLRSWPGDTTIKDAFTHNLVNCMFCHSLERIARSAYSADEFMPVIQRMLTYETDHSSANRIQVVSPPQPLEGLSWFGTPARKIADFLAQVNLTGDRDFWDYEFELLPRPAGAGTRAVVTVFPVPRANSVIHDLDVDQQGRVWYGNTGWDFLGMLDPKTGTFSEWPAPNFLPETPPEGTDRIQGVQDVQVDPMGNIWAAVGGTKLARFIPQQAKWQAFDLPVIWRNPFLSPIREGEEGIWATGLAGIPDGHQRHETAYKLNLESGKLAEGINLFDHMPPPEDPWHDDPLNYCYMMDQDARGDFICTAPVPSGIIRGRRESGESSFYPTPTKHAYPRRGYRDDGNRFWFGEFYADNVGVIDLDDNTFVEYPLTPSYISPYYARPDKRGDVWISSLGSDRLLRLNPNTGDVISYLMPVYYDARKVVVDESAAHPTIWLPNKNTGQLIRVELMDELL